MLVPEAMRIAVGVGGGIVFVFSVVAAFNGIQSLDKDEATERKICQRFCARG